MDATMRFIWGLGLPFLEHAELAFLVAMGFGILFAVSFLGLVKIKRSTQRAILFTTFAWAVFGLFEQQFQGKGFNIRVDFFLSWPPVLATSLTTTCILLLDILTRKPAVENAIALLEDAWLK